MITYVSLLVAILAFSLIVVAHELGHLIAAKKSGIFVIEFAVGMGPKLISKKIGETAYSIRLLPIGGYCKMLGEDQECDDPRAFGGKGPIPRFIVIIAGSLMNFLLGILLIFVTVAMSGYTTTVVENAQADMPAYKAGIRQGDKIVSVDGRNIRVFEDILFAMNFSGGEIVNVVTERNGQTFSYNIVPETLSRIYKGKTANRYLIGISPKAYKGILGGGVQTLENAKLGEAIINTADQFGFYARTTFEALYMLITAQISISELTGIIGIGNVFVESIEDPINESGEGGEIIPLNLRLNAAVLNVLYVMILITINLGIMNLLPFPALDGGRAIFILIEALRRKPIDQEKEGMIHFAGFVLLLIAMAFVTYNDILRVFING